ncbi:MAG: hypothetical protein MZV70_70465 [Desulfobacterales bacterium]|nr:hypothetical protein [Desulfobacterales bacterium]
MNAAGGMTGYGAAGFAPSARSATSPMPAISWARTCSSSDGRIDCDLEGRRPRWNG